MKSFALRGAATGLLGIFLLCLLSCGHDQQLVSISVSPNDVTINGFATVQYRALGQYIHPPQTKDITSTVLWQSSVPSVIDFTSSIPGEAVPTGTGCGTNLINFSGCVQRSRQPGSWYGRGGHRDGECG